jgi:acyl carrier protein
MGMNTFEMVKDFLAERLEVPGDKVTPEALLSDLGIDSLMFAEMLFEFEDRTHSSIDITASTTLPATVAELVALVDAHLSAARTAGGGGNGQAGR